MYSVYKEESDNEFMTPESLRSLLMTSYHIAMDHYSEGPQMCLMINKTLKSVVDSCFHSKTHLSMQFVSHWLAGNTPRLLLPIHRYAVHCLTTSYRILEAEGSQTDGPSLAAGNVTSRTVSETRSSGNLRNVAVPMLTIYLFIKLVYLIFRSWQ